MLSRCGLQRNRVSTRSMSMHHASGIAFREKAMHGSPRLHTLLRPFPILSSPCHCRKKCALEAGGVCGAQIKLSPCIKLGIIQLHCIKIHAYILAQAANSIHLPMYIILHARHVRSLHTRHRQCLACQCNEQQCARGCPYIHDAWMDRISYMIAIDETCLNAAPVLSQQQHQMLGAESMGCLVAICHCACPKFRTQLHIPLHCIRLLQ